MSPLFAIDHSSGGCLSLFASPVPGAHAKRSESCKFTVSDIWCRSCHVRGPPGKSVTGPFFKKIILYFIGSPLFYEL
jgi:hypothetical protein